jgi:hypothetical protein
MARVFSFDFIFLRNHRSGYAAELQHGMDDLPFTFPFLSPFGLQTYLPDTHTLSFSLYLYLSHFLSASTLHT